VTRPSPQQILALAPDAAAARAGRALGTPSAWSETGCDERAAWGLFRGTHSRPYRTEVDLAGPAFRCSCPSRKVPCKHAVGLLLVWAAGAVPAGERPRPVRDWLGARDRRADRAGAPAPPPDPAARAQRAARRDERVTGGVEELRRWLADLVRRGLAEAQREPWRFWDAAAARMVDAQATGLAARVRRLAGARAAGDAWPGRMLEEAALLALLLEAHARMDELPDATRADVRRLIGWTVPADEVLVGERVRDRWAVVGRQASEDERLRSQRTWLRGEATGRDALLLAFGPPGAALDPGVGFGTVVDASLAFYPGAAPLRALVAERHGEPQPLARLPGHERIEDALGARAGALARDPWVDRFPLPLRSVRPARDGDGWALVDGAGDAVAVARRDDPWTLLALSGGHPVDVFGLLDGDALTPVAAAAEGRAVALA
jgi:hypothetical protein